MRRSFKRASPAFCGTANVTIRQVGKTAFKKGFGVATIVHAGTFVRSTFLMSIEETDVKNLLERNALTIVLSVATTLIVGALLKGHTSRSTTSELIPALKAPLPIEFEVAREAMALCIARLHRLENPARDNEIEAIRAAQMVLQPDDADAIRLAKYVYSKKSAELAGE